MTGLMDHRARGDSLLVLTCLRTWGRRLITADRSLGAAAADRIVSAHQELELAQHGITHEFREVIVQSVPIRLQNPALSALARIENSAILFLRKGSAQSRPSAAPETGQRAVSFALAPQALDQRLELANRIGASGGALRAKLSQRTCFEGAGAHPQCPLAVAANRDEFPQRFYRVLMVHALHLRVL
ncbi:MAG TPA: hypothetical protein VMD06_11535 [Steroidobacteraceae bacterium]|nr:hypothetical protein [Steroidobacteraceae bacterium]